MQTDRYDYSPMIRRAPLKWPNDARIALMVAPNIEFFHIDKAIPGAASSQLPDVTGYALRDYGSRVGVFRMMEVLDNHRIRATVLLNADVCQHHPAIIEEGNKRQWEWRGDGSPNTPDHLAAEGFDYLCDWGCDDQPVPMRVESGRMIAVPYQQGLNDIRVIFQGGHTPKDWCQMVCDQFDTLYAEGATNGRVMTLPLHPFVIGLPFRVKYLDKALDYICSHEGVWKTTGSEIADYFYKNYYRKP